MLELNFADVHVMTSLMKMKVLSSFTHSHVPNLFPWGTQKLIFRRIIMLLFSIQGNYC